MNNWRKVKLSEVCLFIDGDRGKNYPTQFDFFDEGYCLFLNASNVTQKGFLFEKKVYLSKEKDDSLRNGKLQLGDIVLTTRGTLGNVALYNDKIPFKNVRINSGMVIIRINKNLVNNYFLYYILISKQIKSLIKNISTGSAQPQIPIKILKNIEIYLPSLDEQKAIAGVLSAFDDKIELNNRLIKNLEEQAQTLYKHWFVDFEFPNENGQPYKSSGGTFKDSELGKIPTDWEVKKLGELIQKNSKKITAYEMWKNLKVIDLSVMPQFSLNIQNFNSGKNFATNIYKLKEFDLLFGSIRSYFGKAGFSPINGGVTGTVHSFSPKVQYIYSYILELITNKEFVDKTVKLSTGTKMPIINWDTFINIEVCLPQNDDIMKCFNDEILPMIYEIKTKILENQKLAEMRDYLLPKLMSGKIRVKVD